jgi:hypothetical protein
MLDVDDVAGEAFERRKCCNPWEVRHHIGVGPHRLHRRKVAPLRVDRHPASIVGGDEAGRDPAIEPSDYVVRVLTQKLNELRLIFRLDGQNMDECRDLFVTAIVAFMVFSK